MCEDYRAALRCDFDLDAADLGRQFTCPALFLSGADGVMNQTFDMTEVWAPRLAHMQHITVPGGHFSPIKTRKKPLRIYSNFYCKMHYLSSDFNIDQAAQLPLGADFTIQKTQPTAQINRLCDVLRYE